ncbi:DUF7674 family protein [Nocardioides lijunqiniae]|uniref:DUF7674 family protein n=1 Tax=Nocardioides lijunqiniae TaxID=2760832 RepID=UPI001877554E|nr:hypothetical protein [Nocardioides lijunqiniae]
MAIEREQVVGLLLEACPSFADPWRDGVEEEGADEGGRLHYVDAAAFARHVTALLAAGRTAELTATFAVIERLHVEGDDFVRELATIGYLEDLQNALLRAGLPMDLVVGWLGPESLRWWRGVQDFWSGRTPPPVRPVD